MRDLIKRFEKLIKKLDIEGKKERVRELEKETLSPDLWREWEKGQKLTKELADLKKEVEDVEVVEDLIKSDETKERKNGKTVEQLVRDLETRAFLPGEYDRGNAYLTIYAGQGGTDAMDWAGMLSRMYEKYIEKRGWKIKLLSITKGIEAGIKNVSYRVEGNYSYGLLKGEVGVHRLVRLSPFNASNLRQTSFASVEVLPEIEEAKEVEIDPSDLKVDTFRASGPGGQFVNKVETAVRVKHLPSNIVIEYQGERSQAQNKERAINLLRSRLYILEKERRKEKIRSLKGDYKPASWGNQIRSYVLHPYKQVKDLRTGVESPNPESILDGNLDEFIEAEVGLK